MSADSNRVLLARVRESSFAEDPPSGPPTLVNMRMTSESLGQDTDTVTSQEIRSDRQVDDVIRTNISAVGDTNHEFSYGTFDEELESAFQSDAGFSSEVVLYTGTAATFTASGSTVAATGINSNAVLGEWVLIAGAANAANNGIFKITAIASGVLTLAKGLTSITDEAPTASVTVTMLSSIVNGTTLDTYFFEKAFTDVSNAFEAYYGMGVNGWNGNISTGAVVTTGFNWLGSKAKSLTATAGDGTNTAASTTRVMNAVDNIVRILEGSPSSADLCARTLTWALNNNLRQKTCIGTLGAFELGVGTIDLTGTLVSFFNDPAIANSYLNFTDSSISTRFQDAAGNKYILDIPSVKYTNARRVAGGINQDVVMEMAWTAFRNSTEGITMRLVRDAA